MGSKITDIAEILKISPATVSRVFNKHPYVNDEIRAKVLEIARKINYAPKSNSNKNTFGIMLSGYDGIQLRTPYEAELVFVISRTLFDNGFTVQIISHKSIPYLHKNSVDALIIISSEFHEELRQIGFPVLTVNNVIDGIHSIYTEHAEGTEMAVDYMASRGHKRIGFISGTTRCWGNIEREKGYIQAVKKNGLEFDADMMRREGNGETLFHSIAYLAKKDITGLIVAGEGKGLMVNHSFYLLNKKIPDDISVITYEDSVNSPYLIPPHTTISQNLEEVGKVLAETAIELSIANPDIPLRKVLKNTLIERQSVRKI